MPTQEDFEHCRTFRHYFDVLDVARVEDPFYEVFAELKLRCTFCTTTRHDELDVHGVLVRRHYIYPEGYRYAEDEEKPTLGDLRLRLLKRFDERAADREKAEDARVEAFLQPDPPDAKEAPVLVDGAPYVPEPEPMGNVSVERRDPPPAPLTPAEMKTRPSEEDTDEAPSLEA